MKIFLSFIIFLGLFCGLAFEYKKNNQSSNKPLKIQGGSTEKLSAYFNFRLSQNQILIQVYIKGKGPFNMYLDSGVFPSSISTSLARELNLEITSTGGFVKGMGYEKIRYYNTEIEKLKVGDLFIESLEAVATKHSHMGGMGYELHGILGYSFLKNYVTTIDYLNNTVTICEELPERFKTKNRAIIKFPFELINSSPIIKNVIVNGERISALLDTGAGASIILSRSTTEKLELNNILNSGKDVLAVGTRGKFRLKVGEINSLGIGAFQQPNVEAVFFESGGTDIIGNGYFKNYILTLDYFNQMVYLEEPL